MFKIGLNQYEMDSLEQIALLIEGCINGNRKSQNQLYKILMPKMLIVCLHYSDNRAEAEEILQEGFIKMFEFIHQYKFNCSFEGWVRKIMVNCAMEKYRTRRQMHVVGSIDTTAIEYAGNEEIISQLGRKELLKIIHQLSPAYRIIFNLYVLEGMKHREIAQYLGISEGTSKSNLSNARGFFTKGCSQ